MTRTPEEDQRLRFEACDTLRGTGFYPIGGWLFMKNGIAYDLSAADLTQIDRIEREGLFVVEITDLPVQAQESRDRAIGLESPQEQILGRMKRSNNPNKPAQVTWITVAPADVLHSWTPGEGVVSKGEAIGRESPPRT